MTHFNYKAMPTIDTNYRYHTEGVEFFNQLYGVYITPLVINSPRAGTTHTCPYRISYKKPGTHWPSPAHAWLENRITELSLSSAESLNLQSGISLLASCSICYLIHCSVINFSDTKSPKQYQYKLKTAQ